MSIENRIPKLIKFSKHICLLFLFFWNRSQTLVNAGHRTNNFEPMIRNLTNFGLLYSFWIQNCETLFMVSNMSSTILVKCVGRVPILLLLWATPFNLTVEALIGRSARNIANGKQFWFHRATEKRAALTDWRAVNEFTNEIDSVAATGQSSFV